MKLIEIFSIGLRLLGIFLLIRSFEFLGYTISNYDFLTASSSNGEFSALIYAYFFLSVFTFSCSICLIRFPFTIAKFLIPNSDGSQIVGATLDDLQIAGIKLLGIYAIYLSVPGLASNVIDYYLSSNSGLNYIQTDKLLTAILTHIIRLIIGIGFTFRTTALLKFIKKYDK